MSHNTCPVCSMGHLKPTGNPYMQLVNGTLVQAPTISGWRCDVCAESFFDGRAVRELDLLIHDAGPPPNHHISPQIPPEQETSERAQETPKVLRPQSEQ